MPFRVRHITFRVRHINYSNEGAPESIHLASIPNRLEVRLRLDGRILVNGLASSKTLTEIFAGTAKKVSP